MNKQHAALEQMPQQYTKWLKDLKQRIHAAQQRATLQVNKGKYSPPPLKKGEGIARGQRGIYLKNLP
jgi:hypothetical protein